MFGFGFFPIFLPGTSTHCAVTSSALPLTYQTLHLYVRVFAQSTADLLVQAHHQRCATPSCTTVLTMQWYSRVGDAWLVGVGKRASHGFRCLWLVSRHGSVDRLKIFYALFPYIEY